jgi:hypothetical protein
MTWGGMQPISRNEPHGGVLVRVAASDSRLNRALCQLVDLAEQRTRDWKPIQVRGPNLSLGSETVFHLRCSPAKMYKGTTSPNCTNV